MPNLKLKFSMNSNLGRHAALIAARRMRRCAKLATDFLASLCTICFIRNYLDLVSWTQLLHLLLICKASWTNFFIYLTRFDSKIQISNIEYLFSIILLAANLESASFTLIQYFNCTVPNQGSLGAFLKMSYLHSKAGANITATESGPVFALQILKSNVQSWSEFDSTQIK